MEPIQESKNRSANEPGRGQPETSPPIDIFQELRERKLKEASFPKEIPLEKSKDEVVRPFPNWIRWFFAALMGGVLSVLVINSLESGDGKKPERNVRPVSKQSVSDKHGAAVMAALKTQYSARDWNSTIPDTRRANPFSIELSDALVQDDSAPVIIRATLMDIVYGRENIEVIFALPNAQPEQQNLLVLSCWKDQLDTFAEGVRGVSEYAVVANCHEAQNTLHGCTVFGGLVDARTFSMTAKKEKIAAKR